MCTECDENEFDAMMTREHARRGCAAVVIAGAAVSGAAVTGVWVLVRFVQLVMHHS